MKLQHLVSVDAIVRHDFNLTRAAAALNTSQPALSMHLQFLEAELRAQLFVRQGNRFVGLSPAGQALLPIVTRAVQAAEELRRTARAFQEPRPDALTVAASQTLARYSLPPLVERFTQAHPRVRLRVRHGTLSQIVDLVVSGEADLSLSTKPRHPVPELLTLPCYTLGWLLVATQGHALLRVPTLSLGDLASFPLITYDETFASHGVLVQAFKAGGLVPNIALMEADSDIMKRYVRSGIGVAVIKDGAYDAERDKGLGARKLDGLLPDTPIDVGVRRNAPLNKAALAFIHLLQPTLASAIRRQLAAPYR